MHHQSEANFMSRRQFLGTTATAAFTIVPRHALGGPGVIPPSDKINLAMIGVGGQGIHDMSQFLQIPEVQVVAVCDVAKYNHFSHAPTEETTGREPARQKVDQHYAQQSGNGSYQGCTAQVDFYDMLEKETGIDAVAVATTDNLHAFAAMAAIKNGQTRRLVAPGRRSSTGIALAASDIGLGPLARPGAVATLPSYLYAIQLAWLVGFRNRRVGRYGLPYLGYAGLGAQPRPSHQCASKLIAAQQRNRAAGFRSAL
jgi:hypothetical protein